MTTDYQQQQDKFYEILNTKINGIQSRYLAYQFQELGVKEILQVRKINELNYGIITDSKFYLVDLPAIQIPYAEITEQDNKS